MLGFLLAVCLAEADASDGLAVKGEVSPERVTAATAPKLRLPQLGALDTALAISLPPLSQQQRSAMAEAPGIGPLRIGFHRDLPPEYRGDLTPRLRWVTDPKDGSMVAAVRVTSPGAVRVRLAVRAELPPGAHIRFFGGAPPEVVGAIDRGDLSYSAGEEAPDLLWSPSVPGGTIGLEITLPSSDAPGETAVVIDRVSHQFRPLDPSPAPSAKDGSGASQSSRLHHLECPHVDVRCRDVGRTADAVALIAYEREEAEAEEASGRFMCSGTLLNDDGGPGFIPYFLTAHHCVSTQSVAATVEAYWFFQRSTCGGANLDPRRTKTSGGADLLATSEAQDSTLLRFRSQLPPMPSGLLFSGWDANYVGRGRFVYGIHHPRGLDKKYVAGSTGRAMDFRPCVDPEDPVDCIHVEDSIPVAVTDGATEGGSSGSGLFRDRLLVGVLSGTNGCYDAWYGRFGNFFPQVRQWLVPDLARVGAVAVQPTSLQIPEGGESTYTLRLELRPHASVTISTRISGDRDISTNPTSVTFTPDDWISRRRITVHAAEDNDQANGSASIAHGVTSLDVAYRGIRVATVTATEKDNDRRAGTVTGVSIRATGEPGELEVGWIAVAGADAYIVEWRQRHQTFGASRRRVVPGTATTTTLADLDGDTLYIVRVIATEEGLPDGNPSRTVSVATAGSAHPFLRGWRLGLFDVATTTPSSSQP